MNEYMVEQLVKKRTTAKDTLIKVALIFVTVLSFFFMMISRIGFVVFAAFVILDMFLFKKFNVEYEYSFFDGSFDIAKIMSKEARKEVFSTNVKEEMELLAPSDAPELQYHAQAKTLDYTSKEPDKKTYTMVTLYKGEKVRVLFEPNEKMLNCMRDVVPRKVMI